MNRYSEHIKLKCANIAAYCDIAEGGAKQMWRCQQATAVYSVRRGEGKEGAMEAVEVEMDYLYRKDISQEQNTTNIILIVLIENNNTPKLSIYLRYC